MLQTRMARRTLICCSGAQNAMAIAFSALCAPGDTILCEAASYSGFKTLAAQLGYRLHGVEMDARGAQPQSLDRAAVETGARVFYTLPNLQNPTARTMDLGRRADIVNVARARNLWIVEDDVYAPYAHAISTCPRWRDWRRSERSTSTRCRKYLARPSCGLSCRAYRRAV